MREDEVVLIGDEFWEKMGEQVSELVKDPMDPKSWANALLDIPIEVASRFFYRRPVVEIHKLRSQLPDRRDSLNPFGACSTLTKEA